MTKTYLKEKVTEVKITKIIYECDICNSVTANNNDYEDYNVKQNDETDTFEIQRKTTVEFESICKDLASTEYYNHTKEKWDICPNCFEIHIRPFLQKICRPDKQIPRKNNN